MPWGQRPAPFSQPSFHPSCHPTESLMENDYVLCNWRGRLWPAKVLPRSGPSSTQRKRKWAHFLKLQILSVGEMISVRRTDVESLNESHIDSITTSLANQAQSSVHAEEDKAWHSALTMALESLKVRNGSKTTWASDTPGDRHKQEPQTERGTSQLMAPHYTVKRVAGVNAYLSPGLRLRSLSVRLQRDPALGRLALQVPPPTVLTPRRQEAFSPQWTTMCTNDPTHPENTRTGRKRKRGLFRALALRHRVKKATGVRGNLPPGITLRQLSVVLQQDPALDRHALLMPQTAVLIPRKGQTSSPRHSKDCTNGTVHSNHAACDRDRGFSSGLSLSQSTKQRAGMNVYLPPGLRLRSLSVCLHRDPALGRLALQVSPPTVLTPKRQEAFSSQQDRVCANDPPHAECTQTGRKRKRGLFRALALQHKINKAAGTYGKLPSVAIASTLQSVPLQHDPTLTRHLSQLHSSISPLSGTVKTPFPSHGMSPDSPSLTEDEHQPTLKTRRGTAHHPALHHRAREKSSGELAALPPPFMHTVPPASVQDVQGYHPAARPIPCNRVTAAESADDPGEGTSSTASWSAASTAPFTTISTRVPSLDSRKRKRQSPASHTAPQERRSLSHSNVTLASPAAGHSAGKEAGEPSCMAFPQDPPSIERGALVWMKFQHHPYWPAVVKSVNQREETARVLLIEAYMPTERRGIQVPLWRLKRLDCREKETLMKRASKEYLQGVKWCFALMSHYLEGRARGSFLGSFLDFYSADVSYPIRRAIEESDVQVNFPRVNYADLEDSEEDDASLGGKLQRKKILPDRMKAAWSRENQKLVDFIVKKKGADPHLLDIVHGKKQSKWLASFMKSARYVICVETYLEDEDQLDAVVKHLQTVYKEMDQRMKRVIREDQVSFVLEVLLPEAIICAIAALHGLDYKEAEKKYLQGPPVHTREKELFDRKILKQVRRRAARVCHAN